MALYKAKRDGLVGASYIHAGEVFSAEFDRDPSWAVRVEDPLEGIDQEAEDESAPEDNEEQEAKPAPKSKKAKGK